MTSRYTALVVCAVLVGLCLAEDNSTATSNSTITEPTTTTTTIKTTNATLDSVTSSTSTIDPVAAAAAAKAAAEAAEIEELSSNSVSVTFYNLKIEKFDSDEYKDLMAEQLTEYCSADRSACNLLPSVSNVQFEREHISVNHPSVTAKAKNLDVITAAAYPQHNLTTDGSNIYYLPKAALSKMIIARKDKFREVIGTDVLEVDNEMLGIKASVQLNIAICVTFTLLTVVLLIVVLVLRQYNNDQENEQRKVTAQESMKRKEQDDKIYKIRPGPEPILRYDGGSKRWKNSISGSEERHSKSLSSTYDASRGAEVKQEAAQGTMQGTDGNSRGPRNLAPLHASSDHLVSGMTPRSIAVGRATSMESYEVTSEHSKSEKKKKKKKRKHKEEEGGVELHGYNNTVYDNSGRAEIVPMQSIPIS